MKIQSKETNAKMNQLIRLLISFNDIKEAFNIVEILMEQSDFEIEEANHKQNKMNSIKCESLSNALTIAYSRPFSGNDKGNKNPIPDLSVNVLKGFEKRDKELHKFLIDHRNKAVAHSDSEIIQMEPFYLKVEDQKLPLLIPLRNKTKFIFSEEELRNIKELCSKLMSEIHIRQKKLERELSDLIPIKELGKDLSEFTFG
ncbi:hypothetical protein [Galbibacter sp. PAP.153]|uniref:hypothetical protein n=1 Tax=Galbibacter sp. PAP.153 TaxID=3104623 RepID=UPI00300B3B8F